MHPATRGFTAILSLSFGLSALACSSRAGNEAATRSDTAAAATSAAPADTATAPRSPDSAGNATAAMPGMTGNPDQDFLRMMSDHHKGLILMSHETIERKDPLGVKADARKLDKEQDVELDRMVTLLEQQFKDPYDPKVTPENKAMVDALQPLKGAAYDSAFRRNVIAHHRQGIQMMDEFLPKLTRADLRSMTEKMKAAQTKEIAEQERKLGRS